MDSSYKALFMYFKYVLYSEMNHVLGMHISQRERSNIKGNEFHSWKWLS